jgi:hypothetical protein
LTVIWPTEYLGHIDGSRAASTGPRPVVSEHGRHRNAYLHEFFLSADRNTRGHSDASFACIIPDADDSRPDSDSVFMRLDSLRNRPAPCGAANSSRNSAIVEGDKEFLTAECESLSDSLVFLGTSSCKEAPRTGRPPLTLWPQLSAFFQKYLFSSARVLA